MQLTLTSKNKIKTEKKRKEKKMGKKK